ncbi:hypothetical protein LVJ94_22785 [Pendulispora rubella]|uniref:Lipoprotein n=1 Tax=Pendulispora rubella TaxID=2741070 RepID=A0ABZ2LH15_9BACT
MKKLSVMLFAMLVVAGCSASSEDSTGDNAPAVEQNGTEVKHNWPCTTIGGACAAESTCQNVYAKGKIECGQQICCLD